MLEKLSVHTSLTADLLALRVPTERRPVTEGGTGTERRPGPSEAAPSPRLMVLTELGPVHAEPKEADRKLVKCPNSWTAGR